MSFDPTSLESDLRNLRAAPLDALLLERLEACASNTMTVPDAEELRFERQLQPFQPAGLSPELLVSLESKVAGTRFPDQTKIVVFPNRENTAPRRNRGWWGAAAAVALTGAFTALLVPSRQERHDLTESHRQAGSARSTPNSGKLVPAGFNRGLSEASDQGVIWRSNNQPQRVLKVVYMDRVTLRDANGRTCEVEQPRVEYILVPAKTD